MKIEPRSATGGQAVSNQLNRSLSTAAPVLFLLMWSSGSLFVKWGLQFAGPLTFLALRLLFSLTIIGSICLWLRPPFPHSWVEWRGILITGLFLQTGYQSFFFYALAHQVSPGLLAIILGTQPIITSLFSREKPSQGQWIGLALGLVGLSLVVADSMLVGRISVVGVGSAILSMVSITWGTFLQKKIATHQLANIAIQYTGSTVILSLLAGLFEHFTVHWTAAFVMALGYMVLVISIGATLLLYVMIRQGSLTRVTSLFYMVPPITALLDYSIFGQSLHAVVVLGMVLIMGGLIIINRSAHL